MPPLATIGSKRFRKVCLRPLLATTTATSQEASMVVLSVVIHPRGLHPMEAMRAWQLHREEGFSLTGVQAEVSNVQGSTPSVKAVWSVIRRVAVSRSTQPLPSS